MGLHYGEVISDRIRAEFTAANSSELPNSMMARFSTAGLLLEEHVKSMLLFFRYALNIFGAIANSPQTMSLRSDQSYPRMMRIRLPSWLVIIVSLIAPRSPAFACATSE